MKLATSEAPPPSVLVVDDEKQIHASLRLRLQRDCHVVCCTSVREALSQVADRAFDLCIVDLHMPEMHGTRFIEEARKVDPGLGFLIFTGNDTDENLRRAIPLQVYDFIAKPLPERDRLESKVPEWTEKTRVRRREIELARKTGEATRDLEISLIERDVEALATEAARLALLQTADTLTTANALLFSATHALEPLHKADPKVAGIARTVQEARRIVESAATLAEGYFSSAYANRDSSLAEIDRGIRDAMRISLRHSAAESRKVAIDYQPLHHPLSLHSTTGIDLLLMLVPAISQAVELTPDGTTLQLRVATVKRIDETLRDVHMSSFLWINRRHATTSSPGVVISLRSNAVPLEHELVDSWLNGRPVEKLRVPGRGITFGIHKSKGLLGVATPTDFARFEMALVLPV